MTAINPGATSTIDLVAGDVLAVASNGGMGQLVITPVREAVIRLAYGPDVYRQRFGPFAAGAQAVVFNQTSQSLDADVIPAAAAYALAAVGAGATSNFTLTDNGTLTVSSNGGSAVVTININGGATITRHISGASRRVFGPYSEGATATVQNLDAAGLLAGAAGTTPTPPVGDGFVMMVNRMATPNFPYSNSGSLQEFNNRERVYNRTGQTVNALIIRFANLKPNGAALEAGDAAYSVQASTSPDDSTNIQNPTGRLRFLFGGANSATVAPDAFIDSDVLELGSAIPIDRAMAIFNYQAYASPPATIPGSGISSDIPTGDVNEEGATGLGSKVMSFISGRARNRHIGQAIAIYGRPTAPVTKTRWLVIGDSIGAGQNDTPTNNGLFGFVQLAIHPWAFTTTASSGYTVQQFISNADDRRRRLLPVRPGAFTHCLMILGGNDVKSGRTGLQIYNNMLEAKAIFDALGIKLIVMTGLPRTNGSNTAANPDDAPGAMAEYIDMSARVRAGNGVGYGYFDRMAVLAAPGDETRWGGLYYDTDGIHPLPLGHSTLFPALRTKVQEIEAAYTF